METAVGRPNSGFADLEDPELLKHLSIGQFSEGVGKIFPLKNPHGAKWILGGVDDTIYKGKDAEVNGWGKSYLPEEVEMRVIGVIEGTSCPCEQLVLMICEDGELYAYDGEMGELHAVASNLRQLLDKGIEYPAAKIYYEGDAFKDMTKKEWAEVKKGPVGKRLDEEHRELVNAHKSRMMELLKFTKQPKGAVSSGAGTDIREKTQVHMSEGVVVIGGAVRGGVVFGTGSDITIKPTFPPSDCGVVFGTGSDITIKPKFHTSEDKLAKKRSEFVANMSRHDVYELLDDLRYKDILNTDEYFSVLKEFPTMDRAGHLFDLLMKKRHTESMIHLKILNPGLYRSLGWP